MKIFKGLKAVRGLKGTVVTIGVFDGVHIGHRAIIRKTVSRARTLGLKSAVLTFDPHPLKVLRRKAGVPAISSLDHRIRLISALGTDALVIAAFTRSFGRLSPEAFGRNILARRLGAKEVYVADNFYFGAGAGADAEGLKAIGERYGFRVTVLPTVKSARRAISSSRIRSLITSGRFAQASKLLGRPVSILGTVVKGLGRGRFLGFRTANIAPHHEAIPPSGVYAVRVRTGKGLYKGILNIGVRPTFFCRDTRTYERTVEAHIFDFRRDIYGEDAEILFVKRLRPEKHFTDPLRLAAQIKEDAKAAHRIL
jgi:riboflavin kinase/FMN adenylyltransferase